jgi:preprotein translocase subunit SecD
MNSKPSTSRASQAPATTHKSVLYRGVFIVVVTALCLFWALPLKEKIKLGLDLQGGMHLVLKVETDDALRSETDKDIDRLLQELEEQGIRQVEIERTADTSFKARGVPADKDSFIADEVVKNFMPGWDFRRVGDQLSFDMKPENVKDVRELAVRQALETIRNRIDAYGVTEPVIHREGIGGDRLVVQLPGIDDPERVKGLIKNTAFLEFRLAANIGENGSFSSEQAALAALGSRARDFDVMPENLRDDLGSTVQKRYWVLEKKRVITGRDLKTARISSGQFNEPQVGFILTRDGGRTFGEVTGANIGRPLAIVLDQTVISAPTIQARITEEGVIIGQFTLEEVQDMVTVLRSGALPAGLTYLEERTVGPSLGQDSIAKGRQAALVGTALTVLLLLVVYNLSGLNAILALALNILMLFAALALFGATLTLPGIAGVVLTIGMAVDANVLIFERIREELRAGRTVISSIGTGFEKALSAIMDSNITTLIAALFLFLFGTGPIRGFAVTLTAIFVSRWLFDLYTSRRQKVEKLSI